MSIKNRLRLVGIAAAAVVAFMAMVGAAQGATNITWTNATTFKEKQSETLKAKPAGKEHYALTGLGGTGPAKLTGTVLGSPIEITSEGLELSGVTISQDIAGTETATAEGKLIFKTLKVDQPVGCGPPASITTTTLTGHLFTVGTKTYLTIAPSAGTIFATVTLTGTCALSETPFKVTTSAKETEAGKFFCVETNPLGTMAVGQKLVSSAAIATACGGTLFAGGNPAVLTGEVNGLELTSGASWGAE
jgi:hypothetical protein